MDSIFPPNPDHPPGDLAVCRRERLPLALLLLETTSLGLIDFTVNPEIGQFYQWRLSHSAKRSQRRNRKIDVVTDRERMVDTEYNRSVHMFHSGKMTRGK